MASGVTQDLPTSHEWAHSTSVQQRPMPGTFETTQHRLPDPPSVQDTSVQSADANKLYPAHKFSANIRIPFLPSSSSQEAGANTSETMGSDDHTATAAPGAGMKKHFVKHHHEHPPRIAPKPIPRRMSLPSQEGPDEDLGLTGGVGALPGSRSEISVAKLPAERTSLPSQEGTDEDLGKTGGAGALPGSKSEISVAKLPDERKAEQAAAAVAPSSEPLPPPVVGHDVGGLPGTQPETSTSKLPDERAQESKESARGSAAEVPPKASRASGEHHSRSPVSGSPNTKPSLSDRIRGEAKVIIGKITQDENKVQAGKHMKGKGSFST
ncbi:hypothetical protein FISHEDRAFT_72333 [Fistulina hepatica ATCC 64428]|uniref:Uncharacterized protein n=1 Tax=Fistulina hepatica ATCC 64428 TaxID=1128425 RepID=A0A0D7AEC8_9AGAR|nr:hypothetical protein FISHEDRAFT_72333 [Fistulina hepatica ATCC 64428]